MYYPPFVRIVEVGPRDGLQNIDQTITTRQKSTFIRMLVDAGCRHIEATSFVSPRAIPQLADAGQVYPQLPRKEDVRYVALVANMRGMERALEAGVAEIAVFTAASETFNQHNINTSIDESLRNFEEICACAWANDIRVRGYVSTSFGCPYEGSVPTPQVAEVTSRLFDMGVYEVSLGDTIGVATPVDVERVLTAVLVRSNPDMIALHMHDTRGTALANVLSGISMGIRTFDASAGGLGGCPFAPGASGNLATEDLVYMLEGMGIQTGINLEKLCQASEYMEGVLNTQLPSRYLAAYKNTLSRE